MKRVVIIGAGLAGLAAAIDLSRAGWQVTVCERAAQPGGKLRELEVQGRRIDAGPTVFTLHDVFASLFADAGTRIEDHLDLLPADILARHAWRDGSQLDLHADPQRAARAIGEFAGADAEQGFRDFLKRAGRLRAALEPTFMRAERPSPAELVTRLGLRGNWAMASTPPWRTLWAALAEHFRDPRLRQLFARYSTYVGASPLAAPATLMLIAHVEQSGVWLVRGGMHRIARALESLGAGFGVRYRYDSQVARLRVSGTGSREDRVTGIELAGGETLEADAVIFNGDVNALASGALGPEARRAAPLTPRETRGLSAITWCVNAETRGFPLVHHNVFFGDDYPAEFRAIFAQRSVTDDPTVYLCAQDRGLADSPPAGAERLLLLVNAPADGDERGMDEATLALIEQRSAALLAACGLTILRSSGDTIVTRPQDFAAMFPGSGGSLYGRANHGALGSFRRPGTRSGLPGLYLAGGTTHPGPGLPMVTLSGRLAAARIIADYG